MSVGRQTHLQVRHELRATVNYNTAGVASGVKIGTLPKGCRVVSSHAIVETAFNAGTTNTLNVGYSAGGTDLFSAQAAGSTAFANATMTMANATAAASADKDVFVQYNSSGTAASAGTVTVIVDYAPDNS